MLCDPPQDPGGLMESKAGNREARWGGPTGTAFVRAGFGQTRGRDGHWNKQGSFKAQRNATMRLKVRHHAGTQQLDIAGAGKLFGYFRVHTHPRKTVLLCGTHVNGVDPSRTNTSLYSWSHLKQARVERVAVTDRIPLGSDKAVFR